MADGQIIQVIGPTVDIRFPEGEGPQLFNALKVEYPDQQINLTLEVAQDIGNNTVRCIALGATDGLVRGMKVRDTGAPISVPIGVDFVVEVPVGQGVYFFTGYVSTGVVVKMFSCT